MSNATLFANNQGTVTIGSNATFQTVQGDTVTNYISHCNTHAVDQVTLNGRTYRHIIYGDLVFRRRDSSRIFSVTIKPEGEALTSRTSVESQIIKVRKTTHTTEIVGFGGTFTATAYEPVDKSDDGFKLVLDCIQKAATSLRSPFLHQLFAFSGPNLSTMIAHNELANGLGYSNQFRGKNWTVYHYLSYTHWWATNSLREDEAVVFPVVNRWRNWSLDLKTLSWHYDPASVAIDPPGEFDLVPYPNGFPLHQGTVQQLNTAEIVTCVEKSLSDVLCLAASLEGRWIGNLSGYAKHGLLTFGTIVDYNKAGMLAHLPSTPPLEWICRSRHPDVKVSFSSLVPWRLDFSFCKPGNFEVTLDVSWCIPEKDCIQLRNAYLCQSLPFLSNCNDVRRVVYIDQVGFKLKATFCHDFMTSSTPAYLFVPPLPVEIINDMKCIRYPFPRPLFYWSHDLQGKQIIAEEKWEEFGIPKLEMKDLVGSYWFSEDYALVQEHLTSRKYNLDGRQYAQDHGYPELIHADPHDVRLMLVHEESESGSEMPITSSSNGSTDDGSATATGALNNLKLVEEAEPDSQHKPNALKNPIILCPTSLFDWLTFLEKIHAMSQCQQEERAKAATRELKNLWLKSSTGSSQSHGF
ncbi:hypothetical protein PQX77_017246 [Marasmius sp. AFHP31]|nr:hypothetical protein PQX77_017246 [Marasmius sp. AFHP31]